MRVLIVTACALWLACPAFAAAQKPADTCLDGRAAMDAGESAQAANLLLQCLATSEQEPEAEVQTYAALGAAYLAEEAFEDALSAYNMAFAIADTQQAAIANPGLWRNRGIARAELGQLDAALSDLQHAALEMPDDVLTYLNMGFVYQQMERHADAVVSYDRIVQLEPEWMGAWLNRSSALLDAGMTSAAVADARQAVELDPTNGSSLNMLCWTLIQDGRADTALPLCEEAVAIEPDTGAIVHSHATALEAVGRLDEALALYRRAHQLDPDDPEIAADFERTRHP
ncbi:tetratricopeptide repeat protein [Maricaulis sp.]|uniref:tetratricopeptide repeat protein n=1 Tax=Maricaulis sp. TaxID=1486257 RepID=UPI003A8D4222